MLCRIILAFLFIPSFLSAQITLPESFSDQLDNMGVVYDLPQGWDHKPLNNQAEVFQRMDYGIRFPKKKIACQFLLDQNTSARMSPGLRASRLALHLASNRDGSVLSCVSIQEAELSEKYGADWGMIFNFAPKLEVWPAAHCQMLVLYREGSGMVYALTFYEESSTALDTILSAIHFTSRL